MSSAERRGAIAAELSRVRHFESERAFLDSLGSVVYGLNLSDKSKNGHSETSNGATREVLKYTSSERETDYQSPNGAKQID